MVYPAFAPADDPSGSLPSGTPLSPSAIVSALPAVSIGKLANNPAKARAGAGHVSRAPMSPIGAAALANLKAQAAGARPSAAQHQAAGGDTVSTASGQFTAATQCDGGVGCPYPPDVNAAVSNTQIVEVVNDAVKIWTKSTTPTLKLTTSLEALFGYSAEPVFDPRVLYDPVWNRWVISAEADPESTSVEYQFEAVSKTANAVTGGWWVYSFNITSLNGTGTIWDYPQLGQNQDAVTVTGNVFAADTSYIGAGTFAFPKALAYNGAGWFSPYFSGLPGTTTPANVIDSNYVETLLEAPSSASALGHYYWLAPGHQGYSSVAADGTFPVGAYAVPPNAPDPGTTVLIDTSDSRFINDPVQLGTSLFAVHTIALGSFAAPRWYELGISGGTDNTVVQAHNIFFSADSFDWNASIAVDSGGDMMLDWNAAQIAGTPLKPSIIVAGRQSADAPSTTSVPLKVFTGVYAQKDNLQFGVSRWGDTSSIQADYQNPKSFWWANESAATPTTWGTHIGKAHVG